MRHLLLVFTFGFILSSCDDKVVHRQGQPDEAPSWCAFFFDPSREPQKKFNRELELKRGEIKSIEIQSNQPLTVGFLLEKGHEIFKAREKVWLGTPDNPHTIGGTPGVATRFMPVDGKITVVVEGASSVDTRVAIYTEAKPTP